MISSFKHKVSWRLKALLALLSSSLIGACQPPTVPTQSTGTGPLSWNAGISSNSSNSFGPYGRRGTQNLGRLQTQSTSGSTLVNNTRTGDVYLNNVPFVHQGEDNTCGQAAMTMVLKYWGQEIEYQQVVNENNPLNLGTSYDGIQAYLRSKGMTVEAFRNGSFEALLNELHQGRPVIALLDFGSLVYAHYVVVVGYNSRRNTVIMHESRSGAYVELDANSFTQMWENEPLVNLPIWGGPNYQRLMFSVQPAS